MLCEVYLQQCAQHSLKKTLHIFLGVPIRVCNSVQFFPATPVSSQTYSVKTVAVMLDSYSKRLLRDISKPFNHPMGCRYFNYAYHTR